MFSVVVHIHKSVHSTQSTLSRAKKKSLLNQACAQLLELKVVVHEIYFIRRIAGILCLFYCLSKTAGLALTLTSLGAWLQHTPIIKSLREHNPSSAAAGAAPGSPALASPVVRLFRDVDQPIVSNTFILNFQI